MINSKTDCLDKGEVTIFKIDKSHLIASSNLDVWMTDVIRAIHARPPPLLFDKIFDLLLVKIFDPQSSQLFTSTSSGREMTLLRNPWLAIGQWAVQFGGKRETKQIQCIHANYLRLPLLKSSINLFCFAFSCLDYSEFLNMSPGFGYLTNQMWVVIYVLMHLEAVSVKLNIYFFNSFHLVFTVVIGN